MIIQRKSEEGQRGLDTAQCSFWTLQHFGLANWLGFKGDVENTKSISGYRLGRNSDTMQSRRRFLGSSRPEQDRRKVVLLESLGHNETTLPSVDNKEQYLDSTQSDFLQVLLQE